MKKTIAVSVLILPLVLSCNVYCRADSYSIGMTQAFAAKKSFVARNKNMLRGFIDGLIQAKAAAAVGAKAGAKLGGFLGPKGMAIGAVVGAVGSVVGSMVLGHAADREAIAAETAKEAADRDLKSQVTSLMREQGMTQNAINTVYNELRNQQAKSREDILAAVKQSLAKADATQEQIAALSTKLCAKVEENQKQLLQATEDIKQGQQLMLGKMDAVDKRMQQEFKILGDDLQNKHAAQMAALSANLQAIQGVDASVAKLNKDMFAEFARLGEQLNSINNRLDKIEKKIDRVLEKINDSIYAYYKNGNTFLDIYFDTHSVEELKKARDNYIHFLNAYEPDESEIEDAKILRGRTYQCIILCQLELETAQGDGMGYTKSAVKSFQEMVKDESIDLSSLNFAYLLFMKDEVNKEAVDECSRLLMSCYEQQIKKAVANGDLNTARALAGTLGTLCGEDNELSKATYAYLDTGRDAHNRFKANAELNAVLNAVSRCVKGEKNIRSDNLPRFAKNIVEGKGRPADYEELLSRFNNSEFVIFSISKLMRAGYKDPAFEILKKYDTANDDFRVMAFLAHYSGKDHKKFAKYKKLVLEDPTFSPAAKAYAEKAVAW